MEDDSDQSLYTDDCNHWREILLDTLKVLWQNYLDTQPEDVDSKEHWIHLFLFHYQYVANDAATYKSEDFQRFFNSIPEEICSFLLQHVYTVVCQTDPKILRYRQTDNCKDIKNVDVPENEINVKIPTEDSKIPSECQTANQLCEDHNFSQLVLDTPSDCNKVVALRNFLTDELGHHLLEFLLKVDIKLIASQKGLCNLCINFFPHCAWKVETNASLLPPKKVLEFVGDFNFHEFNKLSRSINNLKRRTRNTACTSIEKLTHHQEFESELFSRLEDAYNKFKNARKTSDEIAYILVKLLSKCAANECEETLSEQSMTVVLLKFALSKMPNLTRCGNNFSLFHTNATIIKCALLQLIELCLNNVFADDVNIQTVDFHYVLKMLSESYPSNETMDAEHTVERLLALGLSFIIFGIIHNLTVNESRRLRQQQQQYHTTNLENLVPFNRLIGGELMKVVEICGTQLREQIKQPHMDEETCVIYSSIINVLIKIIESIQKVERLNSNSFMACDSNGIAASSNGVTQTLRPRRRRFFNLQQMHCTAQLQQLQTEPTCCFFQSLMLELQTVLPRELQEHNLRYWLRVGICCCHYTLSRIGQFLSWIIHQTPIYQRYTYKFLHRKILNAIFVRPLTENHQPLQGKRRSNSSTAATAASTAAVNCSLCDEKLRSLEYHLGLLAQYRKMYFQIIDDVERTKKITVESTEYCSFILFLRHLKEIASLLPNDIAVGILAEIVLPIFRQNKSNLMDLLQHIQLSHTYNILGFWQSRTQTTPPNKTMTQESEDHSKTAIYLRTLSECLNIFVIYLSDIRLIKAFYNEENIQHLEDLITEPELVCGICELIKIGVENLTFLGDNAREQTNLSRRLINLQLKSSELSAKQFNAVLKRLKKFVRPLKTITENGENVDLQVFWLDDQINNNTQTNPNVEWEAYKHLTPLDVLKNAALLWSLNNDLLRSSLPFYNEFAKTYSIVCEKHSDENNDDVEHNNVDTKFGERNINDILKLNFNALSSFLLIGLRKKTNVTANFHEVSSQSNPIGNTKYMYTSVSPPLSPHSSNENKTDVCIFNTFDTFVEHMHSPMPVTAVIVNDIGNSWWKNNGNQQSLLYHNVDAVNKTLLQRLLGPNGDLISDESIVIFDIRNRIDTHQLSYCNINSCNRIQYETFDDYDKLHQNNPTLLSIDHSKPITLTHETAITTSTTAAAIASVQNSESVIGKLFRMFGSFLRLGSLHLLADLNAQQKEEQQQIEIDDDLKGFFNPQSVCKKLLLKIVETTMAICIKGYQNEEAKKMEKYLQKLKAIILSNAFTHWQQYSEESTSENAVLQALQVLLQIAELSSNSSMSIEPSTTGGTDTVTNRIINNCSSIIVNDTDTRSNVFLNDNLSYRRQSAVDNLFITAPSPAGHRRHTSPLSDSAHGHASHISTESDVDLSENDKEPNDFSPADEGYEADGEIPGISDSEPTAADTGINLWNQMQPTSRYRTYVLHKGLCRLIVSIMIDLTRKCTLKPVGWSDSLALLGKRLFVIRDSLGGSQFLLQSFKPLLECNDTRLKELQQSILELITDLNTPETLCTLFNILTSKTPPVEVIIRHMHYICMNTVRKAQPFVELEFPILIDGNCVSTGDVVVTERIVGIRNYHLHHQAVTPFTRAPCIIPIVHTKVWNNDGLTLSLWFQAKSVVLPHKRSSHTSQTIEEDIRSSLTDDGSKTHIVSIGTSQVMLSIYLSNNLSLSFELIKPNGVLQQCSSSLQPDDTNDNFNSTLCDSKHGSNSKNSYSHTSHNVSSVLDSASTFQPSITKLDQSATPSTFRNALKQTKQVLLNSFSNIIHGPHEGGGGGLSSDPYFESGCAVNLKNHRLQPNKWTHLAMAIDVQSDAMDLFLYIDGLEYQKISIPCRNVRNLTRAHAFQLIALGESNIASRSANNSASYNESQSSFESNPMRFGFSNLMLFNRRITATECLLNLAAMGPDYVDLTFCQIFDRRPNFGYLNLSRMPKAYFGNYAECMRALKEMRVLMYTAQQPDVVVCYDTISTPTENISHGRPFGLILYGELTQHHLQSLQTATWLCGGLSSILYLFARVVEASNNAITQALALDILLSVALSDSHLYAEFLRNDYTSLIGYVIKTERCSKDVHLLRSIVNNACSQPLIHKKSGDILYVNENTTAVLVYPRLLISILHRYSDWHRSGIEHSDVLDMLFQSILALTREKHPQRNFNMEQLHKAGLFQALLNLCKVYLIESPNPVFISKYAAQLYVEIIAVFAGAPATPSLMDEIMKLLLLLHKPSECYITHDRSKFCFLLSLHPPPTKDKTIGAAVNLYRVAAPFRRNVGKERPGVAIPVFNINNSNNSNSNVDAMDQKRRMRINRIKKIHEINLPPYKRSVRELEENLENVADCTKLNKNALKLVDPIQASNWSTLLKRHVQLHFRMTSKHTNRITHRVQLNGTRTIIHRRTHLNAMASSRTFSSINIHERGIGNIRHGTKNSLSTSESLGFTIDGSFNGDESAIDLHFSDVVRGVPTSLHRKHKVLFKTDFYRSQGIIALQDGLFKLLKDFLCLLPDNAVDEVLKHYIKVEILIVLSNHSSCAVRTAILRLLAALFHRLPSSELIAFSKSFYPQHLANQISIHSTDAHMFEACLEWVFGIYGEIDMILDSPDHELRLQQRFGINTLFAIAAKLTTHQIEYAEKAFRLLNKIFHREPDQQFLIENGLLQCCIKALYNLYSKANVVLVNTKTENAILELIISVGKYALKSVGHINIVWDILNMLAFYQENQPAFVMKAFRSVQSQVQLSWISMFFGENNTTSNFKVIPLGNSSSPPSLSETKTRLGLLIDRSCQFFTVFDASYTPSDYEIKLFEFLVSYCISTNQRCNNFIAWGLQPTRPSALRAFIIDTLWAICQDDFQPSIICDGKMIKSLLWLCLEEDLEQPLENLERLCKRLAIDENGSVWNLQTEFERFEVNRCTMSAKQKSLLEKTVYKFEPLALGCIESSMVTTRRVAELQNAERKLLMSHMKDYDETTTYTKWLDIIRRMTHECAPWYCKDRYENSWELDDTEGPSRVHTRLRRCHLDIDKRFIMPDYENSPKSTNENDDEHNKIASSRYSSGSLRSLSDYIRPLDYLISSYDQQLNISLNSQILYNFPAKYLPVDGEIDGEIIITDHKLYFLATYRCKYFYVTCDISNISEIWIKRYQHQEKAFEIFLDTNKSLFFSLQNNEDWKIMRDIFCDKIVSQPDQAKILLITQQWREGLFTNWEYLMTLNQIAGRTYNDLMQYPVFPWILSNYTTEVLDLTDSNNFRKLEKPIAVQHETNEQHYINNYMYLNNTRTNMGSLVLKPYHYSSHYSNSGTVLHFLVRVPPFTSYFLRYQDNNFDLPDRTFHALNTTWNLASRDSPTDVKELIPEFFCLPEMFENFERFNFGCRQNGERVDNVLLPPWSYRDSRLFVLIHRQALECEIVRRGLHQWIDLIFGFKQTGDSAVEAINVFHPATYSSFMESDILDPIERRAVETMVKTYGQMPRQLFKSTHPASKSLNYCLVQQPILQSVRGLRWGIYLGSPQLPQPSLGNIHKLPGAEYLVCFSSTNVIYGLPTKSCVMQGIESDTYNVVSWGHDDRIVRIQSLNKPQAKLKNLLYNGAFDEITVCGTDPNSNQLWFGHRSGRITVYKCLSTENNQRTTKGRQSYVRGLRLSYNSAFRKITSSTTSSSEVQMTSSGLTDITGGNSNITSPSSSAASLNGHTTGELVQRDIGDSPDLNWIGPTVLVRHTDEITCICLSVEFKIAVTAGRDGLAVIWDLNDWSYVRTIQRPSEIHHSPVTLIAISPTLGDIVTVHTIPRTEHQTPSDLNAEKDPDKRSSFKQSKSTSLTIPRADECFEVTEESLDDFVNVSINPNGKSMLRLHTVNARYVQHLLQEEQIFAACYSYIKEGVGVNVVATAIEGGIVRLWSSWNLNFVSEIVTGISNIKSITYSTHQHLVVLTKEAHIQVWETEGLCGSAPKFPQISYK